MCIVGVEVSCCKPQLRINPVVNLPRFERGRLLRLTAAVALFFTSAAALPVLAHEQARHNASASFTQSSPSTGPGGMLFWQWANFALLAAGLAYLLRKNVVPYFAQRSREIHKGIADAEEFRAEAQAKIAAIDQTLANLGTEIESMRRDALQEREAETQRVRRESAAALLRIQEEAAQTIAAAGRAARLELRRYCSELAISSAGQKIAARMSPQIQDRLIETRVAELSKLTTAGAQAQTPLAEPQIYNILADPGALSRAYPVPSGGTLARSGVGSSTA
jgi:F0F1-type ATP synthase membrane subunit b/b'